MTAAAHSSSAVSEEVGLALFLKVGSRGLKGARKGTRLFKVGLNCNNYKTETVITVISNCTSLSPLAQLCV